MEQLALQFLTFLPTFQLVYYYSFIFQQLFVNFGLNLITFINLREIAQYLERFT